MPRRWHSQECSGGLMLCAMPDETEIQHCSGLHALRPWLVLHTQQMQRANDIAMLQHRCVPQGSHESSPPQRSSTVSYCASIMAVACAAILARAGPPCSSACSIFLRRSALTISVMLRMGAAVWDALALVTLLLVRSGCSARPMRDLPCQDQAHRRPLDCT